MKIRRSILFILVATGLIGCASTPSEKFTWEWDIKTPAEREKLIIEHKECGDMAFKAKVAGSKFTEADIHIGCLQRRGYKLIKVPVKS